MRYFVTAIGTDSGKTLVSAILCEALKADYWKPIQAGLPRDTDVVRSLVSNPRTVFHPEGYFLKSAMSPHAAAKSDMTSIDVESIRVPPAQNTLIIEGAGGCLVPLNDEHFIIDLIPLFQAEAIVVSNLYLGSINHTLLTIEALNKRKIPVKGLVFNGDPNAESERIILHHTQLKCLLHIRKEPAITPGVIKQYAALLNTNWDE